MNSEVPTEKSRRTASRLPSESKSSFTINSGNRERQHKSEQDSTSRHWTLASEGFPPGVTVDELKHYRRRRQIGELRPNENLLTEEESQKTYKSEYRRRYGGYDRNIFQRDTEGGDPAIDKEASGDYPKERTLLKRPQCNLYVPKDQPMETATEKNSQYVQFSNVERRKLLRRSTALKPEGEMIAETEVRSQFKHYENAEKARPIRRPPSLKIEGDFEGLTTEQREKFISHLLGERPTVKKKNTLLKMEGDFDFLTEKQVSYVPRERSERPFLRKRSTSLKLDGEVEFFPEYRSSYVDFPRSRPITYKPTENLRNEGELEIQTETRTKFIDFRQFPVSVPAKPANNIVIEGGLEARPEYKENYIDFPRSRPFTMRPENQLKPEGEFNLKTEMEEELSKILNEDVKRPLIVRRPSNLKLEGDLDFSTEKRDKFKGHDLPERLPPARRDGNLLLEGQMEFVTEKGEKYVANSLPEASDFRRKSSFLQSGGEFRSVLDYERISPRGVPQSPTHSRPLDCQPVRSKIIPFKTEHYGFDSELVENCNRRSSRKNSKRLKENVFDPFVTPHRKDNIKLDGVESSGRRMLPTDQVRMENDLNAIYQSPLDRRTHFSPQPGKFARDGIQSDDASDTASVINHQPSFRLEVYNVDAKPQGFHRGNQRVFPPEGIPTETISLCPDSYLEKKREDYYGRCVNCPDVPNYILDKNNNLGGADKTGHWDVSRKPDDTLKILKGNSPPGLFSDEKLSSPDAAVRRESESWSRPNWLTT